MLVITLRPSAAITGHLYLNNNMAVNMPRIAACQSKLVQTGLMTLIGMRLRRVPPTTVVTARISAVKAGIDISINDIESGGVGNF